MVTRIIARINSIKSSRLIAAHDGSPRSSAANSGGHAATRAPDRNNSDTIQDCYSRRLQDKPTLQGKLVVRFDIGPSGKVIGAAADGIQDRELIICVVKSVRTWEFSKPASGGKLRVAYPFKFEPQPSR